MRHETMGIAIVLTGCLFLSPTASVVGKEQKTAIADSLVKESLEQAAAMDVRREETRLRYCFSSSGFPDHAAANWAAGNVNHNGKWIPVEQLADAVVDDRGFAEYEEARRAAGETLEVAATQRKKLEPARLKEQLRELEAKEEAKLARVAERAQLTRHATMHWVRVLQLDPQNRAAAEAVQRAEKLPQRSMAERVRSSNEAWTRMVEVLRGLTDRSVARQEAARRKIEVLKATPAAAPMVLQYWGFSGEQRLAELAVEVLAGMNTPVATNGLVQLALTDNLTIQRAAVDALKRRPLYETLPTLLDRMIGKVKSVSMAFRDPVRGGTAYREVWAQEGRENQVVGIRDGHLRPVLMRGQPRDARDIDEWREEVQAARTEVVKRANMQRVAVTQSANAFVERRNACISNVLLALTTRERGQEGVHPVSAEDWWQWWNKFNEVHISGDKPTQYVYATVEMETPIVEFTPTVRQRCECLSPDTLILTASGAKRVIDIIRGESVVALDVETGELVPTALVNQQTVRPMENDELGNPKGLVRITLQGGHGIVASGGHPFWVVAWPGHEKEVAERKGRLLGWKKASALQPGMRLHTAEGSLAIESIGTEAPEITYNLVVPRYHTYFVVVGDSLVLSHDNTPQTWTAGMSIPGLALPANIVP